MSRILLADDEPAFRRLTAAWLRDLGHDLLLSRAARDRGLFRPETVRGWLRGEGALLPRQGGKLWLVLSLELWLRSFDVGGPVG